MQHMQIIARNKRKIWKPKQYEITATVHYCHTIYCSCRYVVNFVYEYFAVTDSHLQISQQQASLKHENFTVSHHSNTTLRQQKILQQQQPHFSCTLCSIKNL